MNDRDNFPEDSYEQALISLFTEKLGYEYECGYNVDRDYRDPFRTLDVNQIKSRKNINNDNS